MKTVDRLQVYLKENGISYNALDVSIGAGNGYIGKQIKRGASIGSDVIEKIVSTYPDLSLSWLITGQGEMIAELSDNPLNMKAPKAVYTVDSREKDVAGRKGIPLIPTDAFAGTGGGDVSISEHDIKEYYSVPDFGDVDYMIKVKGDSMLPTYRNGDVVALKIIHEREYTQWNRVHVVATSQGVVIKRLHPGSTPNVLMAHSDNPDYPPFEIPTDSITNIALVVGVIRPE